MTSVEPRTCFEASYSSECFYVFSDGIISARFIRLISFYIQFSSPYVLAASLVTHVSRFNYEPRLNIVILITFFFFLNAIVTSETETISAVNHSHTCI